jgi:hypothetical protein
MAHAEAGTRPAGNQGDAAQYTARCPAGPPPARSWAASAGGQSHIDQLTVIRPGPHSCPLAQRSG